MRTRQVLEPDWDVDVPVKGKAQTKAKKNTGKAFEKAVNEQFKALMLTRKLFWERVVDSHDAGTLIRKADCDFKLWVESGLMGQPYAHFIECKSSDKHGSLKNCLKSMLNRDQVARLRMAHRTGIMPWVWFRCEPTQLIEIWPGPSLFECFRTGKRLMTDPSAIVTAPELPDIVDLLPLWYATAAAEWAIANDPDEDIHFNSTRGYLG